MARNHMNRRQFMEKTASVAVAGTLLGPYVATAAAPLSPAEPGTLKKAFCIGVLPRELSILEKFQLAKKVGIEGIEPNTISNPAELQQYKEASIATGVKIHSIMNSDHWKYPLSDNDPEVVKKCVDGIKTSLQNAHDLGADAILLVPGVVTVSVRYADVYRRSQQHIRALIPMARELNVVIAIENVGNRFLLSPLEFARYVDEFESPYVRAYFDVGNIVSIGWPQDWIRTLDRRLVKVHIKRFEPGIEAAKPEQKDSRTQAVDWPEVRKSLREVGYTGWITAEVRGGNEDLLRELSNRMDRIIAGESPA